MYDTYIYTVVQGQRYSTYIYIHTLIYTLYIPSTHLSIYTERLRQPPHIHDTHMLTLSSCNIRHVDRISSACWSSNISYDIYN